MQKYPIGTQTFSILREQGSVYVDKTAHILQLIEENRYCFLARPRRFGKSLTLSTIASIFRGERELFAGLAIDKSDYTWQKHPVIHMSLGDVKSDNEVVLTRMIKKQLQYIANSLEIPASYSNDSTISIGECLKELIIQTAIQYRSSNFAQIVLLIDEYDKPLVNVLDKPELYERNRNIMSDLYRVIKDLDPYLRFTMLTGISRFGRLSLFSELNNIKDITYNDAYATLCGYTEEELDTYFSEELQSANRQGIQEWYNGYRFGVNNTETVYNPFCMLQYFDENNLIRGYWINSGTTSLLVKLARRNNFTPINLQNVRTSESGQAVYSPEDISFESLLLQTGYLTIDNVKLEENNLTYYLRVPNREVQGALDDTFIRALTGKDIAQNSDVLRAIYHALLQADQDALKEIIHSVCASMPNEWYANLTSTAKFEALYCALLYTLFYTMPKVRLRAEESTALGRADLVLELEEAGTIFVLEVKVDADISEAMEQIAKKDYLAKYRTIAKTSSKSLYAMGMTFSSKERNISEVQIKKS